MKVYGADFSGAKNPGDGIYYAEGRLDDHALHIERVVHCDDRLDLLAAIHFSEAPWGLDFPFSVSSEAMKIMGIKNWTDLLSIAVKTERKDFDPLITDHGIPTCEVRCLEHNLCCRAVDASANSFSPFKRTMPTMRMMTYAGLKLLSYLRRLGNVIYPFDPSDRSVSRLYEVYPSHGWNAVGLKRQKKLGQFIDRFYKQCDFMVRFPDDQSTMVSLDAADAAVACITLGYVLYKYDLEADWEKQHPWINKREWANRNKEGLIVKLNSSKD